MTWRRAPLYIAAHDLARALEECALQRGTAERGLIADIASTGRELVVAIGVALSFPSERAAALRRADLQSLRLKLLLRLARDARLLSPGFQRAQGSALDAIGRMIGGWRKQLHAAHDRAEQAHGPGAESSASPPRAARRVEVERSEECSLG